MARKFINSNKKVVIYSACVFMLLLLGGVVGISYRAFCFFIYPHDMVIKGRLQSEIAAQKRLSICDQLGAHEVSFMSDGIQLAGLLVLRTSAKGNMLLCHGYRQNKESLSALFTMFSDYNIFAFDFRGHGQSQGMITTIGGQESHDIHAAMSCFMTELCKRGSTKDHVLPRVIVGFSMGAAAAIRAAALCADVCHAVVADSSYADLYDEIRYFFARRSGLPTFPFLPIIELLGRMFVDVSFDDVRPVDYIADLSVPVMIIHSCSDEVTPAGDALRLYAAALRAQRCATLWIAPPCAHAQIFRSYESLYVAKITKFLSRVTASRSCA